MLPIKNIVVDDSPVGKRNRYKADLDLYWITNEGIFLPAPGTQLILYPKYPEVRLSGFLKGSIDSPSHLLSKRLKNRVLLLGVSDTGKVFGHVAAPESELAKEISLLKTTHQGVFRVLTVIDKDILEDSKIVLLNELRRIHLAGWIKSKRLNTKREIIPCLASNCGGYTLEAELGITPNGYSEPDYLGWEVKQFNVRKFDAAEKSIVTLMTPEPSGGLYASQGVEAFLQKYGYPDKRGRANRINFGGIHTVDLRHKGTGLTLVVSGFDSESLSIIDTDGFIALIDSGENIAASWHFPSLLKHWSRKHNMAAYVPSKTTVSPYKAYYFGNLILLGIQTDFRFFLKQLADGMIYYDPGIKLEIINQKQAIKRRSQFRIKSANIVQLYRNTERVNLINY